MRIKILITVLFISAFALSCKKEAALQKPMEFRYQVKIPKKIVDPTIISGFYGHLLKYEGDYSQANPDRQGEPVQNSILLYEIQHKEAIEGVAYQSNGTTFYDLDKLEDMDIEPKLTVIPNKQGFYQFDLSNNAYCVLVEVKKNTGYYKGGLTVFQGNQEQLNDREIRIDYNASF